MKLSSSLRLRSRSRALPWTPRRRRPSTTHAASVRWRSACRSRSTPSGSRRGSLTTAATTAAAASTSPASRRRRVRDTRPAWSSTPSAQTGPRPWRACSAHLGGCRFFGADGAELPAADVVARLTEFRAAGARPLRRRPRAGGWPTCARTRATSRCCSWSCAPTCWRATAAACCRRALAAAAHEVRRPRDAQALLGALDAVRPGRLARRPSDPRLAAFVDDVREEYFTVLAHLIDSRYYRTHGEPGAPAGKYSAKRRGYVVSMGQDLAAVKISGWTHTIPEYFDFARFWAGYPGSPPATRPFAPTSGACITAIPPTRRRSTPRAAATPPEPTRSRPTTCCSCTTASRWASTPRRRSSPSTATSTATRRWGPAGDDYEGDSTYDRKALTDTEYAAYLVDFTRRVLGLEHRGGLAGHLAHHRPRPRGDGRRAAAALRAAVAQLRAAHADRALQVHDRRVAAGRADGGGGRRKRPAPAASASARTWTSSSCGLTSSWSASTRARAACRRSPTAARPRSPTACCACSTTRACSRTPATTCASTCVPAATPDAASSAASWRRSSRRRGGAQRTFRRSRGRRPRAGRIDSATASARRSPWSAPAPRPI